MIVSRPKIGTIASFVIFLLVTLAVLAMNILVLIKDPRPAWYTYLIIVALTPIAGFVIYKIFIRYKIIRLGNNQLELSYPVLRSARKYSLDQIDDWKENQVKTGKNSVYKELEIRFKDGAKLTLGYREHTEYPRIIQYLTQKLAKKRGKDA